MVKSSKIVIFGSSCDRLTLPFSVISANIAINDNYSAKDYVLWVTFLLQKVSVYLQQPLLRNAFRKLANSVK